MRRFGKYRLLELIASGGMADVWRAEMPGAAGFVKEVALKLVRAEHGPESDFVRMFIQEARLASRLSHANVVQVFDFDEVGGRYYIAMEMVHGRALRQVVDACRGAGLRLGLPRALQIGVEVSKALAYAHRKEAEGGPGIVHRDVSPQNVLVSFEGEVKLADFGIARAMGASGLTRPGTLKGKIAYMAPEQARGEPVDARADVFALGVIVWELCAGRRLFARDSEAGTLAALLSEEPLSRLSEWNEEVPPELDAAVMAALERDPARRTRSAQEMGGALGQVLRVLAGSPEELDLRALMHRLWPEEALRRPAPPGEVTRVRPPEDAAPEPGSATEETTRTSPAPERRFRLHSRRAALLGSLGALAALAVLAAGRALRHAEPPPAAQAESPRAEPPRAGPPAAAPGAAGDAAAPRQAPEPIASGAAGPGGGAPAGGAAPPPAGARAPGPGASPGQSETPLVLARATVLHTLPLPPRASGEGILSVNAAPWGRVYLNGKLLGETPLELRLRAGSYRVKVVHPSLGSAQQRVAVEAGRRVSFRPKLGR